ncbi:MBL fold metallo-hydrolase [Priestia megaterium]|uniref:MBL fold metallo-hydrolase n=1 Tax=Priestia megaterium TaxID=1404 RepID=UPI0024532C4B|nr:MBL fold metallo-hydrolase [Priestia megaterium]MDH3144503.1 MBL fold metallo-hydrolase [Priestia megaterium]MED4240884.1 MBL fold metallo-hydrolase [Priestia megaterium]MED4268108.1 MBL fold metallo-hydrolase [Priestia megaterium]MED4280249.1 MBL fold metallo-hydrolase [Priestia megaterium]MED4319021.1 MBL fold metallo-hydrolase [Priestia megaterium]
MKINQIRNATILVEYANKKFLIDPMLAEKGTYPPFPNSPRQDQNNPLVSLPTPVENIIEGIDAVIVTHLHLDHFDEAAQRILPKDIKMFVQNEEDATEVKNAGFQNVEVLQEDTVFEGIQLIKTKGEHGRGEILKLAGLVCGVIFKHQSEKTLYVAGDTVWYDEIQKTIDTHKPEIIVVNGGDNQFFEGGSLIMGKEDIYEVYKAAPDAKIIVVHMEAVNHWNLSREELNSFINEKEMSSTVLVPDDGESYTF